MPATSERQRKFFGAELGRSRRGEATETGMTESSLRDFARKGARMKKRGGKRGKRKSHRY